MLKKLMLLALVSLISISAPPKEKEFAIGKQDKWLAYLSAIKPASKEEFLAFMGSLNLDDIRMSF